MTERRQFERAEFADAVEIEVAGKKFSAHVRDLSVGGAYVVTAEKIAFGASVKITLNLPALAHKGPRTLVGVVRWTREDGFGIQFGPTGAVDTFALADYVARK